MIHFDFETRSRADIRKVGTVKYAFDPSTQVTCAAYAFDGNPPREYCPWRSDMPGYRTALQVPDGFFECPSELRRRVESGEPITAHNALFERSIWAMLTERHDWPAVHPEQWHCSMATAQYNGLPGGLDKAAGVLGLPRKDSQKTLHKLMKPRPTWIKKGTGDPWFGTSEEYDTLVKYCMQDVEVERALFNACEQLTPRERELWLLDQHINWRGIPIDDQLAAAACAIADKITEGAAEQLPQITGGVVSTPGQIVKIREYLKSVGVDAPDLQVGTVDKLLDGELPYKAREVLALRKTAGGSATKKYYAFRDRAIDGRIYGELIYCGAHTGRWTSRGVQLHNAVKNKMAVAEAVGLIPEVLSGEILQNAELTPTLTTLVRSVIRAEPGKTFIDLDFNAIEARILAWMAGEQELLTAFREGRDPYVEMAAKIYGIAPADVTKKQRALGKVAILGLGYGMGVSRFYETCHEWGIPISFDLAERTVTLYRATFPKIVNFWYRLEEKIRKAIRAGKANHWKLNILYDPKKQLLKIYLPNGRPLFYHRCRVVDDEITYFGRRKNGSYGDVRSWGGKFTENIDQAIARDLLALAMLRLEQIDGVEVLLTVHDETLNQVEDPRLFRRLKEEMKKTPVWATDLPIEVEGWIGDRFKKD